MTFEKNNSMPNYSPPFTLNNKILTLVAEISNKVGGLSGL